MQSKQILQDTGERMVPEFHAGGLIYAEHVTRYMCAQKIVAGKVVLDIASGSGYGTKLLAETASKVYGVDINEDAVAYAKKHFKAPNIEYKVGDGVRIPLEDNSVDAVVTFETIEHIPDYRVFLDEVQRVLKPDGIALVSTPNDTEFAEGNHFHVHEFEYKELFDLLKKDFKYVDPYFQATWKYVAVGSEAVLSHEGPIDIPTVNLAPLKADQYLYFYFVCSNKALKTKVEPLAAIGGHYSDRTILGEKDKAKQKIKALQDKLKEVESQHSLEVEALQNEIDAIKHSKSYRVAKKMSRVKVAITGTPRRK